MISTHWLEQRLPVWQRLEGLVARCAGGRVSQLGPDELQELGLLYRQVAADLATLRDDPSAARYAASLGDLLARAHHTIYAAERPALSSAVRFLRDTFPRTFRRHVVHCVVAAAVFAVSAGVGAALALRHPDLTARVLGPRMVETIERGEMWTESIVTIKPLASSAIMTNNMSVAFVTFAAGITGGIGTLYYLALNGFMLGVVGAACAAGGLSLGLWSFVAPHGVLELPAIFIAGGAGLRLAQGMLFPGVWPRRHAITVAGRDAVVLILGCVPVLVIAGVIEAFVSPTDLPVAQKFIVAIAVLTLFAYYLLAPGRAQARSARAASPRGSD
jgi:uncharacterized membrane protein SpoIIM required for sporulation